MKRADEELLSLSLEDRGVTANPNLESHTLYRVQPALAVPPPPPRISSESAIDSRVEKGLRQKLARAPFRRELLDVGGGRCPGIVS
jgi:hypothetical protein